MTRGVPDRQSSTSSSPSALRIVTSGGAAGCHRATDVPSASGPWNRAPPSRHATTIAAAPRIPSSRPISLIHTDARRQSTSATLPARSRRSRRSRRPSPTNTSSPVTPARGRRRHARQGGALEPAAALDADRRTPKPPRVDRDVFEPDVRQPDGAHLRGDEVGHLMVLRRAGRTEAQRMRPDRRDRVHHPPQHGDVDRHSRSPRRCGGTGRGGPGTGRGRCHDGRLRDRREGRSNRINRPHGVSIIGPASQRRGAGRHG